MLKMLDCFAKGFCFVMQYVPQFGAKLNKGFLPIVKSEFGENATVQSLNKVVHFLKFVSMARALLIMLPSLHNYSNTFDAINTPNTLPPKFLTKRTHFGPALTLQAGGDVGENWKWLLFFPPGCPAQRG